MIAVATGIYPFEELEQLPGRTCACDSFADLPGGRLGCWPWSRWRRSLRIERRGARRCVRRDPFARAAADAAALFVRDAGRMSATSCASRGRRISSPGREELLESRPVIGENRRSARGGFEEPHRRRIAGRDHVGAGQVQRETRGRIERRDARAGTDESCGATFGCHGMPEGYCGPATRKRRSGSRRAGSFRRSHELRLAVGRIGSEITQVAWKSRASRRRAGRCRRRPNSRRGPPARRQTVFEFGSAGPPVKLR